MYVNYRNTKVSLQVSSVLGSTFDIVLVPRITEELRTAFQPERAIAGLPNHVW